MMVVDVGSVEAWIVYVPMSFPPHVMRMRSLVKKLSPPASTVTVVPATLQEPVVHVFTVAPLGTNVASKPLEESVLERESSLTTPELIVAPFCASVSELESTTAEVSTLRVLRAPGVDEKVTAMRMQYGVDVS